jgi:hypothetical protein
MIPIGQYEPYVDRTMSFCCCILFFLFGQMTAPIKLIAAMPLDLLTEILSLGRCGIQNILNLLLFGFSIPLSDGMGG